MSRRAAGVIIMALIPWLAPGRRLPVRRSAAGLQILKSLPVLTISDGRDFAQTVGIMERFVEAGRMRFAVNLDSAGGSGVHLSSRLLGLGKIIGRAHDP